MHDFVMTGSSATPKFNPDSFKKMKNGTLTTKNNTGGTVYLTIMLNGAVNSSLFTSGASSLTIPVGDQTLGTIADVTGEYTLQPTGGAMPQGGIGNNVKVNVGVSGDDEADEEEGDEDDAA